MLESHYERQGLRQTQFSRALAQDWERGAERLGDALRNARVLVLGGAGTIGRACIWELLGFPISRLDIIDIDENGLARLARDLRATFETVRADLSFMAMDFGGFPGLSYVERRAPYDLVLNFAAVKHVRSEKNLFTVLHMVDTNVVKPFRLQQKLIGGGGAARFFSVSTDKAVHPASYMGATKALQEQMVFSWPPSSATAMARFPNVAYSSGSLLESFAQRLSAGQPLAAPRDTRRYFVAAAEAARICLLSQYFGAGRIAVPAFTDESEAVDMSEAAALFLEGHGLSPEFTTDVAQARRLARDYKDSYPVVLTPRDTSGEKSMEIFQAEGEALCDIGLSSLAAITPVLGDRDTLDDVLETLSNWVSGRSPLPELADVGAAIARATAGFSPHQTGLSLDDRI